MGAVELVVVGEVMSRYEGSECLIETAIESNTTIIRNATGRQAPSALKYVLHGAVEKKK